MAKVYVLGAGASRAFNSGAPLMYELLKIALDETLSGSRAAGEMRPAVQRFIEEFYGSGNRFGPPPLEDVLSQLDYCIINNLPLSYEYDVSKLRELRQMLIYLMGRAIQTGLGGQTNGELVEDFLKLLRDGDSIITLNYDLIIDNVLFQQNRAVNYGILTRNPQREVLGHWYSQSQTNYQLLKLHGSLNWLYCPICRVIDLTETTKGGLSAFIREADCPECSVPREAVIISPSFLKEYNNNFVIQVWRLAELKLQKADEVVFIGYSLPDADIVLRMLFTRALFTNRRLRRNTETQCQIRVVNWVNSDHKSKPGFVDAVQERYTRLFNQIDYDYTGFQAYIKRGGRTMQQIEEKG